MHQLISLITQHAFFTLYVLNLYME